MAGPAFGSHGPEGKGPEVGAWIRYANGAANPRHPDCTVPSHEHAKARHAYSSSQSGAGAAAPQPAVVYIGFV